jgi:hypothetical protein
MFLILALPGATPGATPVATPGVTPATAAAPGAEAARAAFARFQALAGDWRGKSTQGWDDRVTWEPIAGGSAVMETSLFEAHPDQTMVTVVHLDGDRLLLTHYCVAGNQPRMVAQAFEDGGRTIRFGFLDATNLASPDDGHMHSAVFRFTDDSHYTSQWSFHREGKEAWMEEIVMERAPRTGTGS